MSTAENVVQVAASNMVAAEASAGREAAQMGSHGGEVWAMAASVAADVAGGADRGPEGLGEGDVTGPVDAQSTVRDGFPCGNGAESALCHTPCHKLGHTPPAADLVARASNRGGRGCASEHRRCPSIGLRTTQNFCNADTVLVEVIARASECTLLGRQKKGGGVVVVLVEGVEIELVPLPAVLACQKKSGGELVFSGPVPAWRCPQCMLDSPRDCMERPCGWITPPQKKKGGATL